MSDLTDACDAASELCELIQMADFAVLGFCDYLKGCTPKQRHFDGVHASILIVRDAAQSLREKLNEMDEAAQGKGASAPTA